MAHQAGFDNVVIARDRAHPGSGRAFTRYAKKIALAYDVDAAGEGRDVRRDRARALIGQLAAADTGVELDEVRVVRCPTASPRRGRPRDA
jgi:hypothetical protein